MAWNLLSRPGKPQKHGGRLFVPPEHRDQGSKTCATIPGSSIFKDTKSNQTWTHTCNPKLRRLKQENHYEVKASLGHIGRSIFNGGWGGRSKLDIAMT